VSEPPLLVRSSIAATVVYAFSQASSSVRPRIGRNATWNTGAGRPASSASWVIVAICSAVPASGSPHSA
jgi:hypothetical protein